MKGKLVSWILGNSPPDGGSRGSNGLPPLWGDRILLREFQPSDAEALMALYGDGRVGQTNAWRPLASVWQAKRKIARFQSDRRARLKYRWGIFHLETGVLLGDACFTSMSPAKGIGEISYNLCVEAWGQGYMQEALRAMLHFGSVRLGFHTFEAAVLPDNKPSIRLLERLGFESQPLLAHYRWVRGRPKPVVVFRRKGLPPPPQPRS